MSHSRGSSQVTAPLTKKPAPARVIPMFTSTTLPAQHAPCISILGGFRWGQTGLAWDAHVMYHANIYCIIRYMLPKAKQCFVLLKCLPQIG